MRASDRSAVHLQCCFRLPERASLPTLLVGLLVFILALPVRADAPLRLEVPIDCDMERTCSIQKHVDLDPGPQRMDYACGRLSLDGDTGTDFRLPDYVAMDRGVAVLAAAAGVVKATRDGMQDVSVNQTGRDAIRGREAGNGVVIDHGSGWETQYSHLKRGSILVKRGDTVTTGQPLGLVGLSGNTEFPHVEMVVRFNGRAVDPFVGMAERFACGDPRTPLWSEAALAQLPYRPSGPLIAGFAADRPDAEQVRHGTYAAGTLPADPPALVFWADIWGAMAGDQQRIRIVGPDNRTVHENAKQLTESNVSWFAFSGLRRPAEGWLSGPYTGTFELTRNGIVVVSMTAQTTIASR